MAQDARVKVSKRPSMKDVAEAAGVSVAAVSKVIRNAYGVSPAMRQRVEAAVEKLNYRPSFAARALRGQTYTIGFEIPQLGNDFFTQVMQGADSALEGTPYQLLIASGGSDYASEDVLNTLIDRHPDGIIAIAPNVSNVWIEETSKTIPFVLFGRHDESKNFDTVNNDDHYGTELVMNHLIELGHTNIAHLTVYPNKDGAIASAPHSVREAVFRARMKAIGQQPVVFYTQAFEPEAAAKTKEILDLPNRPTAIFAGNDTLALGALRTIGEAGLTSKQISVVGYDDIYLAGNPLISLTTVNQSGFEMGQIAAEMILERISGDRTLARKAQISPNLVVRNSSQQLF